MDEIERVSSCCSRTLCVAVNYGGRAEVVDAVNKLIASGKTSVTEEDITSNIYSGIVPPPDVIVRTGGEVRLSNFLMWQSAYSELFFTDTLWPDFSTEELDRIIDAYGKRDRRFGGV
jgi:undecaprenyl diphosphate synthase